MGKIVRALTTDGQVMICAIDSSDIVAVAAKVHKTNNVVTAALGRLISGASMMGAMLKGKDHTVTLRFAGGGETGSLIAVADSMGNVKGYVANPVVELPLNKYGKLDVSGAVGKEGTLSVIKDLMLKDPYVAQVPIVSGEIAEDLTYYFAKSEQTPTVCGLGVLVNKDGSVACSGGYIVQLLPFVDDETIDKLEANIDKVASVSQMLKDGLSAEDICRTVLSDFEVDVLDEFEVNYCCNCTKEKVEKMLISLGVEELGRMAEEDEFTEVSCHFCNNKYVFDKTELLDIIKNAT